MPPTELRAVRRPVCLLWRSPVKGRSSSSVFGSRTPDRRTRYICFHEIGADTAKGWRIHRFGSKTHSDLVPIPHGQQVSWVSKRRTIYRSYSEPLNITRHEFTILTRVVYCAPHCGVQHTNGEKRFARKRAGFMSARDGLDVRSNVRRVHEKRPCIPCFQGMEPCEQTWIQAARNSRTWRTLGPCGNRAF
jgi:hypothetical protein